MFIDKLSNNNLIKMTMFLNRNDYSCKNVWVIILNSNFAGGNVRYPYHNRLGGGVAQSLYSNSPPTRQVNFIIL